MGRPDTEMLSASQMEGLLQDDIASLVSNILASVSECNDTDIETRLSTIKKTFDLTDEEIEVVSLFYLREVSSELCIALEGVMPDLTNISVFRSYGNILLGFDKDAFLNSIAKANLVKADILSKRGPNSLEITSWCVDYLSGLTKADLSHEFFSLSNDETLDISDFNITEDDLLVLDALIKSSSRQNILFYGAPGTGKSSFARSLAKKYGK